MAPVIYWDCSSKAANAFSVIISSTSSTALAPPAAIRNRRSETTEATSAPSAQKSSPALVQALKFFWLMHASINPSRSCKWPWPCATGVAALRWRAVLLRRAPRPSAAEHPTTSSRVRHARHQRCEPPAASGRSRALSRDRRREWRDGIDSSGHRVKALQAARRDCKGTSIELIVVAVKKGLSTMHAECRDCGSEDQSLPCSSFAGDLRSACARAEPERLGRCLPLCFLIDHDEETSVG